MCVRVCMCVSGCVSVPLSTFHLFHFSSFVPFVLIFAKNFLTDKDMIFGSFLIPFFPANLLIMLTLLRNF